MSNDVVPDALLRFLHGETDPATFHHPDHVRMAFEILSRHTDFLTAAQHYSRALKTMTKRVGAPAAYHETITLGFLALVGERMAEAKYANFEHFAHANTDLLEKDALERWYDRAQLRSALARRTFVLPRRKTA